MAQPASDPDSGSDAVDYDYDECREHIQYWTSRSKEVGLVGSKCIVLKYQDLGTESVGGDPYKPHQVVWLYDHRDVADEHPLPKWPDSVSHLCGVKRCINGSHYICELIRINWHERLHCHNAIRAWIHINRGSASFTPNSQYTVALCTGIEFECKHKEHPCFISV